MSAPINPPDFQAALQSLWGAKPRRALSRAKIEHWLRTLEPEVETRPSEQLNSQTDPDYERPDQPS